MHGRSMLNTTNDNIIWYNLKGNTFEEPKTQWYNLRTNRLVNNKPGTYNPVYGLKGIRILGTKQDIEEFWKINSNKMNGKILEDNIFEPFDCIKFLSEDAVHRTQLCFVGTAGSIIESTESTDVETLTNVQMNKMCRFTFGGLFVKGKIDSVIDGDTFDLVFYAPLMSLGKSRTHGKVPVLSNDEYKMIGFFTKVMVRMYGYDAAEKDTDAGKLAKKLMEDKFKSINNIVWCQFIESNIADDKYGRSLTVLYEDERKEKLLNTYLIEQEKIHNMKMVFPYIGGTKKKF